MAKYILGDKEVTEEEFYKTVFFLDGVIGAPSWDKCLGIEDITKIILAEDAYDFKSPVTGSTHHTGGTVFEKVQDSTSPNYSAVIENCNKAQENYLRNHLINQTEQQKEVLDNYNSIVGHSAKSKEIKPEDIWNNEKGDGIKKVIMNSKSKSGIKETSGKLDYSEINFNLLDLMAKRFMDNKVKYPKGNTLKEIDQNEILWAAFRHIRKMIKPVEGDTESYQDHLAAVATNMSIILDQIERK